jgi:hypothetical protein
VALDRGLPVTLQHYREHPETSQSSSKREAGSEKTAADQSRSGRLKGARAAAAALLDQHVEHEGTVGWSKYLRPAAEHILEALSDLLGDDEFWDDMQAAELATANFSKQDRVRLSEIMESDLTGLLDHMGHGGPPPASELAEAMQIALSEVLDEPDRARRAERTRNARCRVLIYVYHLRGVLNVARTSRPRGAEKRLRLARLQAAVQRGVLSVAPAVAAAGAAGALFGPEAAGAAAIVAAGRDDALRELTKQGVQAAGTAVMSTILGGQEDSADAMTVYQATAESFCRVSGELIDAIADLEQYPVDQVPTEVQAHCIEATRWYFQLERAQLAVEAVGEPPPRAPVTAAGAAMRALRDWIDSNAGWDELSDIRAQLTLAFRQLSRYTRSLDQHKA